MTNKIGILGGGQLGLMLIQAGKEEQITYSVLDKKGCSCFDKANTFIDGDLYDHSKIQELAECSEVLTFEIEHVSVDSLKQLENNGVKIIPKPHALELIQDKGLQKELFEKLGLATSPFKIADNQSLTQIIDDWPDEKLVIKHRKGGYDGKGVQVVSKDEDLVLNSESGFVVEKLIKNAKEISVIVNVDQEGNLNYYEPTEMVFDSESNMMDYLISPISLDKSIKESAIDLATKVVRALNSPGIFAVELFVNEQEQIYINEIAPRPHNSGHHTIESAQTSQYQQLNRILLNKELGDTTMKQCSLTANIVGPKHFTGPYELHIPEELKDLPSVYYHMYLKSLSKPFRKLGHFTVLANSTKECIELMSLVKGSLRIVQIEK